MRKIVAVGGEPATGKSTLVKELIQPLEPPKAFHLGSCHGLSFEKSKLIVLGQYPKHHAFGGTDRLSMAVQPHAKQLLETLAGNPSYQNYALLFEGDRLFNQSFLNFCFTLDLSEAPSCAIYVLEASDHTKTFRHQSRGDTQPQSWLKGRITKVARLKAAFPCHCLPSDSVTDLEGNLGVLRKALGLR